MRSAPPSTVPAPSLPVDDLYWSFRRIQAYEAWAVHGPFISGGDRQLGPGVKERFEFGSTLGCEVAAAETKKRQAFREELRAHAGEDGFLVLPTVPGAAPLRSASFEIIQDYRERALRLLCLSGLSGLPADHLPLGGRRRALRHLADRPGGVGPGADRAGAPDHERRLTNGHADPHARLHRRGRGGGIFGRRRARSAAPRRSCRNMSANWRTNSAPCS
jgi:hypothetical protein